MIESLTLEDPNDPETLDKYTEEAGGRGTMPATMKDLPANTPWFVYILLALVGGGSAFGLNLITAGEVNASLQAHIAVTEMRLDIMEKDLDEASDILETNKEATFRICAKMDIDCR